MSGHAAASNPATAASTVSVDVAGHVDSRQQQQEQQRSLRFAYETSLPASTTRHEDRRHSLPLNYGRPTTGVADASTGIEHVAAVDGRIVRHHHRCPSITPAAVSSSSSGHRSLPRRPLNISCQPRHRTGAAAHQSLGQPVIVRTYSAAPPLHHRHRVSAILEEAEMAQPELPPVNAFSFDDIMKNVESDVSGALDAIAGICASCRYSMSDHYDVHLPPHAHGRDGTYLFMDATMNATVAMEHAATHHNDGTPSRACQVQVDLLESEYHIYNHRDGSDSTRDRISPMALIDGGRAGPNRSGTRMTSTSTSSNQSASLTGLPAPEIITEVRRAGPADEDGYDEDRLHSMPPPPPPPPHPPLSRDLLPRPSLDGRDPSIPHIGDASQLRRSSMMEQFVSWFPWTNEHDQDYVDGGEGEENLRSPVGSDLAGYRTAETRLRGLLATHAPG